MLVESLEQSDARVRLKVVEGIGKFYEDFARDTLVSIIENEQNPEIVGKAAEGLGKFPDANLLDQLAALLERDSFRHRVEMAAITAMRKQDRPNSVDPLLAHLREQGQEFGDRDFGKALKALGFLARNLEDREEIRTYIAEFVSDPRTLLHVPAIEALVELGDPRSVALLEDLTVEEGPRQRVGEAAKKAVEKLTAGKPTSQELRDLRSEVLGLQTELRKLRESLDALKREPESKKP